MYNKRYIIKSNGGGYNKDRKKVDRPLDVEKIFS